MGRHKYPCASLTPSSCVFFTGKKPKFLAEELECDVNLNEVIEKIGDALDTIQKATDVTALTSDCVTLTTPKTPASVLVDLSAKICALSASIQAAQQQIAGVKAADELINIDLGCLAPAASACQVSANNYKLISILSLFKTEICAIKSHLGI